MLHHEIKYIKTEAHYNSSQHNACVSGAKIGFKFDLCVTHSNAYPFTQDDSNTDCIVGKTIEDLVKSSRNDSVFFSI